MPDWAVLIRRAKGAFLRGLRSSPPVIPYTAPSPLPLTNYASLQRRSYGYDDITFLTPSTPEAS